MENKQMVLLTPGPLTTSKDVRESMMVDMGTRDGEYQKLVQKTRSLLLELAHASEQDYSVILMQGSGTYGVESVLSSVIKADEKVLILSNGAYGERMGQICEKAQIPYRLVSYSMIHRLDLSLIEAEIAREDITHVAYIHSETTAGVLNDIAAIQALIHRYHKISIVDAMSSFGGVVMDLDALGVDYLVTSSNKCLHGVPGVVIVFARRAHLQTCANVCRSLSLDLYDQYQMMETQNGSFRFTSPTHVIRALYTALLEIISQGGVEARYHRYQKLQQTIYDLMVAQGFQTLVPKEDQSAIITTYLYQENFDFAHFYAYFKNHGFLLYSGKLAAYDAFRIGNIGVITDDDMKRFASVLQAYGKEGK